MFRYFLMARTCGCWRIRQLQLIPVTWRHRKIARFSKPTQSLRTLESQSYQISWRIGRCNTFWIWQLTTGCLLQLVLAYTRQVMNRRTCRTNNPRRAPPTPACWNLARLRPFKGSSKSWQTWQGWRWNIWNDSIWFATLQDSSSTGTTMDASGPKQFSSI